MKLTKLPSLLSTLILCVKLLKDLQMLFTRYQVILAYTEHHNNKVLSFLEVMEAHIVNVDSKYSLIILLPIRYCEATSKEQYAKFINECLQPNQIEVKLNYISCNAKKTQN